MKYYDIAIIGGGPAGYTAALYAERAGYSSVVIEKATVGGQMAGTSSIENYPGFDLISGFELSEKMKSQAEEFGCLTLTDEVTGLMLDGKHKKIKMRDSEIEAGAVVIATGAKQRLVNVPGEAEYTGRGVSYCATCDGMFFRKKTAVVLGGGNTAFEDAMYLSNICEKVMIIHRRDSFRAAQRTVERAREKSNIEFIMNSTVEEILGDGKRVIGVVISDKLHEERRTIDCSGVFVAVGRVPETELFRDKLELDESGYIVAGESCKTSVEGVFVAGDVRTKELRQIVTACADGACAIKSAEEWLG